MNRGRRTLLHYFLNACGSALSAICKIFYFIFVSRELLIFANYALTNFGPGAGKLKGLYIIR
jgi:hypothetical protein